MPPLNTRARLWNGTEENNRDIYVCLGPWTKQEGEMILSNIFEDLKSLCYQSDNNIIVGFFNISYYVIRRIKVHLHSIDQFHNTTAVAIFRYHMTRRISERGWTCIDLWRSISMIINQLNFIIFIQDFHEHLHWLQLRQTYAYMDVLFSQ